MSLWWVLFALLPTPYQWPLAPPEVTRRFEAPPQPWLPGHRGVDLGGTPGATVRAAAPGTVLFARVLAGRGVISVAHAGGLRTTYEPVHPAVTVGETVTAGEPLGTLDPGHPGCPAAACLHWGVRRGADYLDPLTLLGLGRVRLLPLQPANSASRAGR
ncbi:M23 family metallopeptidase [Actinoplanes teichomyceticus]|uniref:Peptidase M23-like protein n=1 Tax=Actinoplanes teichomyceticus TaxID=1867 RepID=A0A561WND2_ACTTI|nr:M23 family metallopeptidase [Actinoplanes teichomyceticus]TWG25380.1 peptidase M23-like protein [Actinoplanes teichomyceticus]GIF10447.1 peptidase M23 [Actinoplanes teichomyceticus]